MASSVRQKPKGMPVIFSEHSVDANDLSYEELVEARDRVRSRINTWRRIQAESADRGSSPDATVEQLLAYNQQQISIIGEALLSRAPV